MSVITQALDWGEDLACKYLKHRIRDRIREWIASRFGLPVAGSILAWTGWSVGLALDFLIPVAAIGLLSATLVGIPVAILLLIALFTATCE